MRWQMSSKSRKRASRFAKLHCEPLEARRVLASFVVNDLGDTPDANPGDGLAEDAAGNTTLRAAIEEANALAGSDDISFSVAGNVLLSSAVQLDITDNLEIDGGGAVTVDGGGLVRVFNINDGDGNLNSMSALIKDITITGGLSSFGGGILNYEMTRLENVVVSQNVVEQPNASYDAFGAGIANAATMTIFGGEVSNNDARDPIGTPLSNANGGGIANYGTNADLTLTDTIVSGNSASGSGGGINGQQNVVRVLGSMIVDNTSGTADFNGGYGGGINMTSAAYGVPAGAIQLRVVDSVISGNATRIDANTGYRFPYGGGVYAGGFGTVTFDNTIIRENYAGGANNFYTPFARGAGAFFSGFGGTTNAMDVRIQESYLESNTALAQGGAIGIRGRNDSPVNVIVDDSIVENNTAGTFQGGAFFTWGFDVSQDDQANLLVRDSIVTGNEANNGGASMTWNGGSVIFERSTLSGNYTRNYGGGAIDNRGVGLSNGRLPGSAEIIDSTISGNTAAGYGGGVWSYDGELSVFQSTISGNTAANGGGGGFYVATYGPYVGGVYETFPSVERTTIVNNYAAGSGGGGYVGYYTSGTINNSIISGNADQFAFATDIADIGSNLINNGLTYSFIGNNLGSGLIAANPDANGNIIGDSSAPLDAMLGPLGDNGGTTETHLPMMNSPVVDVADAAATGMFDQRGFGRIANGRMDIGSVELDGEPPIDGDFNRDGLWDCTDINMLTAVTAAGTNDPNFDLTRDGLVNTLDISAWLILGGVMNPSVTGGSPFLPGDADLNGAVDGADFILWNTNKFSTNTDWCGGNFDGNGATDGADFIIWNANKFMTSDAVSSPDHDMRDASPNQTARLRGKLRGADGANGINGSATSGGVFRGELPALAINRVPLDLVRQFGGLGDELRSFAVDFLDSSLESIDGVLASWSHKSEDLFSIRASRQGVEAESSANWFQGL